ncbi:MAG: hypothetical protein ABSF16_16675 [Terracidiphilus sp.]|jgi:hypothetical protein
MTDESEQDPKSEITEPLPQSEAGRTVEILEKPYDAMAEISGRLPVEEPPKPARNFIFIYAAILAGIGVLVAAAYFAMPGLFGDAKGRYDLGTVVSSPDGLNGHLYTRWVGQLEYRLKIEPGDQHQLDGFSLAVNHLPRPVSFYIQLLDPENAALCNMHILMNSDPATTDAGEHGNNLFQNIYGPSGQIVAISSEGTMPCSNSDWGKAVSWSFTSNFPTLDEQKALQNSKQESIADAAKLAAQKAAREREKLRSSKNLAAFSIEADDAIVNYDAARGIIETRYGRIFYVKKSGAEVDPRWQDYPVSIHLKCDRSSMCTLMHAGAGALHARMSR